MLSIPILVLINFTSVFIFDNFSGINLFVFWNSNYSLIAGYQTKSKLVQVNHPLKAPVVLMVCLKNKK
jgi:hypothetical protein